MNLLFANYQHNKLFSVTGFQESAIQTDSSVNLLECPGHSFTSVTQRGLLGRKGTIETMRPGLFVF